MNTTATQPEAPDAGARRYQCRHIFAEGHRCRALSLRQEHFCYAHHTSRHPLPARHLTQETFINPDASFILPPLEDRPSIQLAISELARRVAANQLDMDRAKFLLRCCRHATANLPKEPRANKDLPYQEQEIEVPEPMVEAFELDPILGPLAPIAEAPEPLPPGRTGSYMEQLIERLANPSRCSTCYPPAPPKPAPDVPYPFPLPAIQAVAETNPASLESWVPHISTLRCGFTHRPKQNAPTAAASPRPWGTPSSPINSLQPSTCNRLTAPLPHAHRSGSGSPRLPWSRRSCRPRSSLSAPR
jgi:hypothetical protein